MASPLDLYKGVGEDEFGQRTAFYQSHFHPEQNTQPQPLEPLAPQELSPEEVAAMNMPAPSPLPPVGPSAFLDRKKAEAQVAQEAPAAPMGTAPVPTMPSPAPAPMPTSQIPGMRPDGLVLTGQSSQTTTQKTKLSPEYKKEMDRQTEIGQQAQSALDKKADVDVQLAEARAAATRQAAVIEQQEEQRRQAVEEEKNVAIKEAESAWQQKVDQASKFQFKDLWSQKTKGQQAGILLAMAVSSIGAALQAKAGMRGVENGALKVFQREEEMDYQRQRDNLAKIKDEALMLRTGIQDAKEARSYALASLEVRRAARLQQAKLAFDQRAAELGTDQARADAETAKAELDLKLNASKLNALEPTNEKITRVAQQQLERPKMQDPNGMPKMTESQGKATDLVMRMVDDEKILESTKISKTGLKTIRDDAAREEYFKQNPMAKIAAQKAGAYKSLEEKLSRQDLKAWQAGQRFVNSYQRDDSGGAIQAQEYLDAAAQYLPTAGDTKETLEIKRRQRQGIIEGKTVKAGPGAHFIQEKLARGSAVEGAQAPSGGSNIRMITTPDGRKVRARILANGDAEVLD